MAATTKQYSPKDEVSITDKKKIRRQSQSRTRTHFIGVDVTKLPTVPSLFLLLLLSGSHLPKNDAFQFLSIRKNYYSNKPSIARSTTRPSPATTNGLLFLRPRRRKRQQQFYGDDNDNSSVLSLTSQSIDGRSESKNSTEIIENSISGSKEEPPVASIAEVKTPLAANIAEAKVLRARAQELRAEARAMELELKLRASKQQRQKDMITDEIITTLFLPLQYQDPQLTLNGGCVESGTEPSLSDQSTSATTIARTIPDARVVADRLRQGKFSRQQIISVVDRLYEQHHDTNEQEGGMAFTNTSEPQRLEEEVEQKHLKQQEQQVEKMSEVETTLIRSNNGRYSDYVRVLVQAAVLLDESIVANTPFEDTTKTAEKSKSVQTVTIPPESTSSALPVPSSSSLSSSSLSSLSSFNISSSDSSFPPPMSFVTSGKIGKAIQSRISELRQSKQVEMNRRIAEETNRIAKLSASSGWSSEYSKSANNNGASASITGDLSGETPSFVPLWIPSAYIPYIVSLDDKSTLSSSSLSVSSKVGATNNSTKAPIVPFAVIRNSTLENSELEILKTKVLMGSRFYMTSFEFAPGAALFRGNMRTSLGKVPIMVPSLESSQNNRTSINNNTAMVFENIQERLEAAGLEDKVQLFVLPDPETIPSEPSSARTQSISLRRPHIDAALSHEEEPVLLALPKQLTPDESKLKNGWIRKIGKRLSYPVAALSMFFYSLKAFALNPNFFDALVNRRDAKVLCSCIPLALGFLSVQLIHEVAHYLVAKRKKIKIGFPVPVSTMFYSNIPFFGCITPLRSFPPNRAALVDFALSGPMASLAVSLCMVFGGVMLTSSASPVQIARFPFLSVHTMKSNFLLGSILSWLLPKTMMLPLAQPIPMHPLFVVGRFGMISSALNLLPIFRLDGGRACFAAMGQRQGAVISAFTILWIVSNFFMNSSMLFVWTLIVALFQMRVEIPCRDECTEVGGKRELLWFFSFLLSISILIPFPHHGPFL